MITSASVTLRKAVVEIRAKETEKMGRAYSSPYEAWAKLKEMQERTKTNVKTLETLQGDVWTAVKDQNEEAVAINLRALSSTAMELCAAFATIAAEAERAADEVLD